MNLYFAVNFKEIPMKLRFSTDADLKFIFQIFLLLKDSPELIPIVAEVTFTGFGPGSLVMGWSIVFAAENESEADIVHHLERALNAALLDETIKVMLPFNVSNAYVLSVSNSKLTIKFFSSFDNTT